MKTRKKLLILLIIINVLLTTCSATINPSTGNVPVTSSPTTLEATATSVFLPLVTSRYYMETAFGVDGRGSFDRMNAAGVNWLRLNEQLRWADIEIKEGIFDWTKAAQVEKQLIDASKNGLNVILLIQTVPQWARKFQNSTCGPIREDKFPAYGNFVHQVVKRYSQPPYNVKYYQIGNEPDTFVNETESVFGCWVDPADTSDANMGGKSFGRMLTHVYPQLKAANPNAQLVMGSLMMLCDPRNPNPEEYCADVNAWISSTFFQGVLETGRTAFDVVSFNSGPSFVAGENPVYTEIHNWRWEQYRGGLVNGKIGYLRETMAASGIDKPIIHSEAYLLDRPENDPIKFQQFENYKADYLVWVYANGISQKLKAVIWYSIEGWKGSELLRNGTEESLAYKALKNMVTITRKSQNVVRDDSVPGYTKFTFINNDKDTWLFIPTGKVYGQNYSIPKPAKFVRAVDIFGVEQTIASTTITFNRPFYVIVNH